MLRTRKVLAVAAMVVAMTMGGASVANAGPWEFAGSYPSEQECEAAGAESAAEAYKCILFEGVYDLYVR